MIATRCGVGAGLLTMAAWPRAPPGSVDQHALVVALGELDLRPRRRPRRGSASTSARSRLPYLRAPRPHVEIRPVETMTVRRGQCGCPVSTLSVGQLLKRRTVPSPGLDGRVGGDVEDAVVGVDAADAAQPGQRVGALAARSLEEPSFANSVIITKTSLAPMAEVHRPADGGDRVRRARVPVGEVAVHRDLEGAEHADVEMAAAHHREGVGVVEVRRPGQLGDRDLAGVDQVGVDRVAVRLGSDAEHAVLGVEDHPLPGAR